MRLKEKDVEVIIGALKYKRQLNINNLNNVPKDDDIKRLNAANALKHINSLIYDFEHELARINLK